MNHRPTYRLVFGRAPAVAAEAMIASSHPLATRAGIRAFERGGNAMDAALAAAAALCIGEPWNTGIGGDTFAIIWQDGSVSGLDSGGAAPMEPTGPLSPVEEHGSRSVTVPGTVGAWAALGERFGRLGLDVCLRDAIDAAETGTPLTARASAWWAAYPCPPALGPRAPSIGTRIRMPELASTLRKIANNGADAVYRGEIAQAIASVCWLSQEDLDAFSPRWVTPLRGEYRGCTILELPPPNQGVVALEALGLLQGLTPSLSNQISCARLALEDGLSYVRDDAEVGFLLDPSYLATRRHELSKPVTEPLGGTSYVCAVDGDRLAVSMIQSLYKGFGSGVVAPGTGIVLQNRGAGFSITGRVEPGKRPYHTIIPAMMLEGQSLLGPFGITGGFIQAQAHMQFVSALFDEDLDPQAALDKSRFRVDGDAVLLEEGLWPFRDELSAAGHQVVCEPDTLVFGCGQAILVREGTLFGGSDPRQDGFAAGF